VFSNARCRCGGRPGTNDARVTGLRDGDEEFDDDVILAAGVGAVPGLAGGIHNGEELISSGIIVLYSPGGELDTIPPAFLGGDKDKPSVLFNGFTSTKLFTFPLMSVDIGWSCA